MIFQQYLNINVDLLHHFHKLAKCTQTRKAFHTNHSCKVESLLFYIKKGANWSFPLGVEGIKSDFIRFMCDAVLYESKEEKKKRTSQIKRTFTFLQLKNMKPVKEEMWVLHSWSPWLTHSNTFLKWHSYFNTIIFIYSLTFLLTIALEKKNNAEGRINSWSCTNWFFPHLMEKENQRKHLFIWMNPNRKNKDYNCELCTIYNFQIIITILQ